MSGNMSPREPYPSVIVDASVVNIPPKLDTFYRNANRSIAVENLLFRPERVDHLALSQEAIRTTAKIALRRTPNSQERNAIILGTGGGEDLPLAEIIDSFDHTTLVDVNTEQTEKAVSDLPQKLLGKVTLRQADITGSVLKLSTVMEEASKAKGFTPFMTTATNGVRHLANNLGQVDLGRNYSFVSSHLVMSQLAILPLPYINEKIQRAHMSPPYNPDTADFLDTALDEYNTKIQLAHVAQLARLVSREGTVHFADTIAASNNEVFRAIHPDAIKALTTDLSTIGKPMTWGWYVSPQKQFLVLSAALESNANRTNGNSRR